MRRIERKKAIRVHTACTISGAAFREKHGQTCIGDDVKSPRNFSGVDVCETRAYYTVYINIFLLLSRVFFFIMTFVLRALEGNGL